MWTGVKLQKKLIKDEIFIFVRVMPGFRKKNDYFLVKMIFLRNFLSKNFESTFDFQKWQLLRGLDGLEHNWDFRGF